MNSDENDVKYYRIANQVVMCKDGMWYVRDEENHQWLLDNDLMRKYYDVPYYVEEISYEISEEYSPQPSVLIKQDSNISAWNYCPVCGSELKKEWIFCPICGNKTK